MLKLVSILLIILGLVNLLPAKQCRKACYDDKCYSADCDVFIAICQEKGLLNIEGITLETYHNGSLCFCQAQSCTLSVIPATLNNNSTENLKGLLFIDNVQAHQSFLDGLDVFFHNRWMEFYHITIKNGGIYSNAVVNSLFSRLPSLYFSSLRTLDASNNKINGSLEIRKKFPMLSEIILSNNQIENFKIQNDLPSVEVLKINSNRLSNIQGLSRLKSLKRLDLSQNYLSKVNEMSLKSNENQAGSNEANLHLDLSSNGIRDITQIRPILFQLETVTDLNLAKNHIRKIYTNVFPKTIYKTVRYISLHSNEITHVGANSLEQFQTLENLDLTNNLLQHLPVHDFSVTPVRVARSIDSNLPEKNFSLSVSPNVSLDHNPWSCDCYSIEYHSWVISSGRNNTFYDFVCQNPEKVAGRRLSWLLENELVCVNASAKTSNISANEFEDAVLICNVTGAPLPIPYWISPINETISAEDPDFNSDIYSISPNGQVLTVQYLQYYKTGVYRCVANNTISESTAVGVLGVLLASYGTVIAIVVSSVAFMVAMLLNLVNLCLYLSDHIKKQRQKAKDRRDLKREQENLENAKLREKEFYESAASLNANRYYNKYDFTCQQMFLDTVVKGAHTVKKTIYDAKHSEFSNNMWEYAAYLRNRLHIDLPSSVQFPRVSMPTISMPNISIPSFQGINTNIEKIGSSVMNRSHKITTSVGSVFTLRWLRSANPSDQSSGDECEAGPSHVHQVKVRVHHHRNPSMESSSSCSSNEMKPCILKKEKMGELNQNVFIKGNESSQQLLENVDDAGEKPRRTKSVRFYKAQKEFYPGKLRRTASYTEANSSTVEVNEPIQENDVLPSVSKSVHEFETCL